MDLAQRMVGDLKARGCDYSLLFRLRLPHTLIGTETGRELGDFLKEYGMCVENFYPCEVNRRFIAEFMNEVKRIFREDEVSPIAPRNYIVTMNKGGKMDVMDRYSKVNWPHPREPYCMQTMGSGDVLFIMCQTWQDGLTLQRDILSQGGYVHDRRFVSVEQVYEHQWGDSRVVCLMVDWEIMYSCYQGRVSIEEALTIPGKFPAWLVGELKKRGLIDAHASVECTVKDKTRAKGSDLKISKHFMFNIAAVMLCGHYQAMSRVIEEWVERLRVLHTTKNLNHIGTKEELVHPVWGWDNRLLRGQNGIGTLFGKKKGEKNAPVPSVDYRLVIKDGVEQVDYSWKGEVMTADHPLGLIALYRCSYTVPHVKTVGYTTEFLNGIKVKLVLESRTQRPS